jgi:hypothetical protein
LARHDPLTFLENCLRRYHRDVRGYRMVMEKTERLFGHLYPREVIDVYLREKPHSVFMSWREGARKAERVLYVEGENNGKMLARPAGSVARLVAGDVVERDVDGSDARQSGRFTLNIFGLKKSVERTLASWKAGYDQGQLYVEYLGVHPIRETGNRPCYHFHRVCAVPENDGVMEQTVYIDHDTWLMRGLVIKGEEGKLIGEYYFRDIEVNPQFKADQFQRASLIP